jgi:hypothetical protein
VSPVYWLGAFSSLSVSFHVITLKSSLAWSTSSDWYGLILISLSIVSIDLRNKTSFFVHLQFTLQLILKCSEGNWWRQWPELINSDCSKQQVVFISNFINNVVESGQITDVFLTYWDQLRLFLMIKELGKIVSYLLQVFSMKQYTDFY